MIDSNTNARAITNNSEILQLLIDSALDYALILMDVEGRVVLWNVGAERLLGWTQADILGQLTEVFFTPEDQQADVPRLERERALQEGRIETERWQVRRDGSPFWAASTAIPLKRWRAARLRPHSPRPFGAESAKARTRRDTDAPGNHARKRRHRNVVL